MILNWIFFFSVPINFKFSLKIMSFPKTSFLLGHCFLCRLLKESAKYLLCSFFSSSSSFSLLPKYPLLNLWSPGFSSLVFHVGVHFQPPTLPQSHSLISLCFLVLDHHISPVLVNTISVYRPMF